MVVEAYIADGSEKFRKTNEKRADIEDGDEDAEVDEDKRLNQFGEWLEEEGAK